MSATPRSAEPITVVITDPATSEVATQSVPAGKYALVCAAPCVIQDTEINFVTGVVTITLTGYAQQPRPSAAGPELCPQGCGGHTTDPYGGPCTACWNAVTQPAVQQ
ncbi:hypothetical protein [Nonomuraea endophytica]|uniref:hypothetical protein n=1 Tax=Nonomuraea endophytica TaxID=714136 RepID=UPI0037CCB433